MNAGPDRMAKLEGEQERERGNGQRMAIYMVVSGMDKVKCTRV